MDDQSLDRLFRDGLNKEQEFDSTEANWNAVSMQLVKKKDRRRRAFLWFFGLLFLAMTSFFVLKMVGQEYLSQSVESNLETKKSKNLSSQSKVDAISDVENALEENPIVPNFNDSSESKSTKQRENNRNKKSKNQTSISTERKNVVIDLANIKRDRSVDSDVKLNYADNTNYTYRNEPFQASPAANESKYLPDPLIEDREAYSVSLLPSISQTSVDFKRQLFFSSQPILKKDKIVRLKTSKWDIGLGAHRLINVPNYDIEPNRLIVPKVRYRIHPNLYIGLFGYQLDDQLTLIKDDDMSIGIPKPIDPTYNPESLMRVDAARKSIRLGVDATLNVLQISKMGLSVVAGVETTFKENINATYHFETIYSLQSIEESFQRTDTRLATWKAGAEMDYRTKLLDFYVTAMYRNPINKSIDFNYRSFSLGVGLRHRL